MTHHKIQSLTDLATTGMAPQDQFRPLQQERGLRRVLLSRELLKPTIKIFRNTQIHSHAANSTKLVPDRY